MGNGSNRYTCRHVRYYRSARPVDDFVLRVIRGRLALPDLRELLAKPVDEGKLRELAAARKQLRLSLEATEADYDNDVIDGRPYKAKTEKLTDRLEAIRIEEAKLVAQSGPDSVFAAEDPVAAFDAAPLAIQQQVIDTLATVTLHKGTDGSRTFVPESVAITWRE